MDLVIATHNPGKLREIADLLGPSRRVRSAGELGLPEPEETGSTFTENALIKARAAAQGAGIPALADDSGLSVESLGGAPGIYSARWAGPGKDFGLAMRRVLAEMEESGSGNSAAAFICVLALVFPDGTAHAFEGRVEGQIVSPPRGEKGFGYDPIFVPAGHDRTFAEIEPAEKAAISHRARAFEKLRDYLEGL